MIKQTKTTKKSLKLGFYLVATASSTNQLRPVGPTGNSQPSNTVCEKSITHGSTRHEFSHDASQATESMNGYNNNAIIQIKQNRSGVLCAHNKQPCPGEAPHLPAGPVPLIVGRQDSPAVRFPWRLSCVVDPVASPWTKHSGNPKVLLPSSWNIGQHI